MPTKIGAVLVIGGGISGIQSALDLADSGFKVYLLDKKPSIGGTMAQLDKTFPTNDCSMCIMSPKMVDVGRHPNVELLTYSELESIDGTEGNFRVIVKKRARYVDIEKCVGCGLCAEACRMKGRVNDDFNEMMGKRSAIYVPFPQAVPLKYTIDPDHCIHIKTGKCGDSPPCKDACAADAIDHGQKDEMIELSVGSIVVSTGLKLFDPHRKPEYGYGDYKNIITSLQFERLLSASGPTSGHIVRPSDGREPKKIAFIQCVGSRDQRTNPYCSSVCCTYAIKEAIVAREHSPELESTIFAMEERTFGAGFENYRIRAENEYGVRIVKGSRIPHIEEVDGENLSIRFLEGSKHREEEFDLVVLSVGIEPPGDAKILSDKLGIDLNEYGFCSTTLFDPLATSRPGIFVSGVFSGPKDIPETVAQASGVAARASEIIASERNTLITDRTYPTEVDVIDQEPRIGVFVCHCGINIGGIVDVPGVTEYARTLPNVVYAENNLYTCSQDTQKIIMDRIKEHKLNRVVVASCSPRTHEPLFQDTIRESGLNPYLFEMPNIRDQCSWVHMKQPEEATQKSKDLIRMAVAKAPLLQPLSRASVPINPTGIVLGGGLAGMTAAVELAKQGYTVDLIEKTDSLGGNLKLISFTLRGEDPSLHLKNLIKMIEGDPHITVHMETELESLEGYVGNFTSTLTNGKRIEHGIIIVATGAVEYKPKNYLYGEHPNVMTQLEYEQKMAHGTIDPKSVVIIHCVGARDENTTECGRICCSKSIKSALETKKKYPDASVFSIFKDIRTYGFKERYYQEAGEKGIVFIRRDDDHKPVVTATESGLEVFVHDAVLDRDLLLRPDIVVLSSAVVPNEDNKKLAKLLKVPIGKDGYFLEAHVKLRPLDFATDGIFLCGLAHSPRLLDESISMASAAAARAITILSKPEIEAEGIISVVDQEKCLGCGDCEDVCEFGAPVVTEVEPGVFKSMINEVLCKGCGACIASCCNGSITCRHYQKEQIMRMVENAITSEVIV